MTSTQWGAREGTAIARPQRFRSGEITWFLRSIRTTSASSDGTRTGHGSRATWASVTDVHNP